MSICLEFSCLRLFCYSVWSIKYQMYQKIIAYISLNKLASLMKIPTLAVDSVLKSIPKDNFIYILFDYPFITSYILIVYKLIILIIFQATLQCQSAEHCCQWAEFTHWFISVLNFRQPRNHNWFRNNTGISCRWSLWPFCHCCKQCYNKLLKYFTLARTYHFSGIDSWLYTSNLLLDKFYSDLKFMISCTCRLQKLFNNPWTHFSLEDPSVISSVPGSPRWYKILSFVFLTHYSFKAIKLG